MLHWSALCPPPRYLRIYSAADCEDRDHADNTEVTFFRSRYRTQGHGPCAFLALVGAFYTAHSDTDKDQYKFFYQKQLSKKTGHQDCGWAWVEEDRFLKKSLKRC